MTDGSNASFPAQDYHDATGNPSHGQLGHHVHDDPFGHSPLRGGPPTHHHVFDAEADTLSAVPDQHPLDKSLSVTTTTPTPSSFASSSASQLQFRSHTIAPSPPPPEHGSPSLTDSPSQYQPSPLSAGSHTLRISTDIPQQPPLSPTRTDSFGTTLASARSILSSTLQHKNSASSLRPISRTPSFKTPGLGHSIGTLSATSSAVPSPIISAMGDVTPLPSPLLASDSPGPWKRLGGRPASGEQLPSLLPTITQDSVLVTTNGESIASALANASKRKSYAGLMGDQGTGTDGGTSHAHVGEAKEGVVQHGRNRSISEYIPDPMLIPKRHITVSGSHIKIDTSDAVEPHLRRELNLAESRGLTPTITQPPTPPPSETSRSEKDSTTASLAPGVKRKSSRFEYFEAYGRHDGKRRRWRAIKLLGQGTFSRVMLATSQAPTEEEEQEEEAATSQGGMPTPTFEGINQPDRKTLVAVKVCEHGPRGGASEDRIEMSLKRELEIMQSIRHPSLVDLKAWNIEPTRAILVLSFCPGGDLFDVATSHREVLTPALLRRMFAELVGAVGYLHERRIVHRDIKLENVLVNLPASELADPSTNWTTYPYSVVTLTDLGLSRRIADDEKLETRCGSDDYAAPEVIMGQPYDGRATDAWSLGVLLYALLEARLPFDPHPGASDAHRLRSRTSHRIARVEWRWIEYAGEDGDHEGDEEKFKARGLLGAMEITEGLLKRARSRWGMDKVAANEWVRGGIVVDGGMRFREEEEGEEVL